MSFSLLKGKRRRVLYGVASLFSVFLIAGVGYVLSGHTTVLKSVIGMGEDVNSMLPVNPEDSMQYPVRVEILLRQAEVELAAGEAQEAIKLYERALEQGGDLKVMRSLFDAALLVGDIKKAESVLGLLSFRGVPESSIDALRGLMLIRKGELADARRIFMQHTGHAENSFGLLITSILEGDHEGAKEQIEFLLKSRDPLMVHSAQTIKGAYDEFALFEEGKEEHLKTLLARALGQIGQWPAASVLLSGVTADEPDYRDAYILLGYSYFMMGESESALGAFESARSIDPEKAETQYFLGRVHEKLGNELDAITFFGYALQNGFTPKRSVRERLANLAIDRGSFEEAIGQLMAIVDEGEADAKIYRRLITLVLDYKKDTDQARDLALQAQKEIGDSSAEVLDLVGWTAFLMGDLDEAETYLMAATSQDPSLAPAWFHNGLLTEQVGDRSSALASFRRAYEESIGSDQDLAFKAAQRHNALLEGGGDVR